MVAEVEMNAIQLKEKAFFLAACIAGFFLMLATVMIIGWLKRRGREGARTRGMVVSAALVLVALYLATPWVESRLAEALYRMDNGPLRDGFHFQNGPHVAPVLGFALVMGFLHALQKDHPRAKPPARRRNGSGNTKWYD
jgi:hypothetical protein